MPGPRKPVAARRRTPMSPPPGPVGTADLRAPFERLVDTGLRLSELRDEADLHELLIAAATELSGAERVLLVLEAADGPRLEIGRASCRERV